MSEPESAKGAGTDQARERAEEALRATEERLRHLVEHAQDLIYNCDPDGRFTFVNPAAARVMEYAPHELVGRHFMRLIHPDHHAPAGALYARQRLERTPSTYLEFLAVTKSGGTIWLGQHVQLVTDGKAIVGMQAIARDITRHKKAEERLRRSEAKYRSLIHGAAYGIYRSTTAGQIQDANPAFARMLGYESVDEVTKLNMNEVYWAPGDRTLLIERDRPGGAGSAEIVWRRKDGTPITVWLTARVVDLEAEGSISFEGVVQDITAKRALEMQLREAQKLEAVGILARGVAHDFNNLLAAILGCSNLLVARLPPGDPSREDAEEIGKAAARGAALTRQLLAFGHRQAISATPLNLVAVVQNFEGMLRRIVGEAITLEIETSDRPVNVRAELGHIEQVMMNLVINARDAIPAAGRIRIGLSDVDLDTHAVTAYPGMPPGHYARITVHDTGAGIPPNLRRHIFEPFFTTKSQAEGSGLGLSIVYGIAHDAGGTVSFSTSAGEGTTFEVLLPITADLGSLAS